MTVSRIENLDQSESLLKSEAPRTLLRHFRALHAGGGALPERRAIDPAALRSCLPSMAILDLARRILWVAMAAIAAVVVLLGLLVSGYIANPIAQITAQMDRLGKGDTDIAVDIEGKDEVADMGRSLIVFRDNLVAQRELEAQAARQQQAQLERAQRVAAITDEFQTSVAKVLDTTTKSVAALETTAQDLTRISATAQELSAAAAAGSNEASSNVQTVAAATEELTASIKEISRQIARSSESANKTADLAASSEVRVRELSEVAVRIGDVVKMINSIA